MRKKDYSLASFGLRFLAAILIILTVFAPTSYAVENKANFTDNQDGTVTDNQTGLMWQKDDTDNFGNWKTAMNYCRSLSLAGHSDWWLPERRELVSLWNNAGSKEKIKKYFPNMPYSPSGESYGDYWSSTTYNNNDDAVWIVSLFNGGDRFYGKVGTNYVRCVRLEGK